MQTPTFPGDAGVPVGRVDRPLLVTDEYVPDARRMVERIVGGEDRPAGVTENHLHLFLFEAAHQGLGHGNQHGRTSRSIRSGSLIRR